MKNKISNFVLAILLASVSALGDTPARPIPAQSGHSGQYLKTDGTNMSWNSVSGGSGTVTSVNASVPSYMSLSGNPITTSGTLAFDFNSQTIGKFFASPSGGSGVPSFRAIVAADVPTLNQNTTGNAGTATALAANPTDCVSNNYANAIDANGNLTCAQVAYTQITGAPSLHYQTVQSNTTPVTQRSNLNFTSNFSLSDSVGSDRTSVDLASSITANVTGALTGNASTATALAANPTDCASDRYATTIDASGNLICAQVTNSGLAGSIAAVKLIGSDITTVGTITSGTWNGTVVDTAHGGTGQSTLTGLNIPSLATDIITFSGQGSGPTTPSAGNFKLYADTNNGRFKIKDSSGSIFDVGITWLINYTRDLFSGTSLNGINTYNDGTIALPVDGTGGVVSGLTTALNASSPLQAPSNIRFSKDAANRQGEGWSWDISLDRADFESGRPVPITLFQRASANYAYGDLKLFVYDKTFSSLVPGGISCLSNSDGSGNLPLTALSTPIMCYFYPNTLHSDYRIIFHITSTNAAAWDFDIARLKINPDDRLLVAPSGPVGEIIALGSSTAPANFIAADGSAISRTAFAELFAVIGTTYGVGDGSTTFNVPNGAGVYIRGVGTQTISGVATPTIVLGTTYGDTLQGHVHAWQFDIGSITNGASAASGTFNHSLALGSSGLNGTVSLQGPSSDGSHGTPRVASETAPASIGAKFYIRYTSQSNVLSGSALTLQTPTPTTGSSSVKTPTASGNWNLMSNNSLTLTTGMWRLSGSCVFNASGSPAYTQTDCVWAGANGADTVTAPAALGTVTGLTLYAGLTENYTLLSTGALGAQYPQAPVVVVKCSAATCVVFLDTYSVETTPSAARISVLPNAEKIPDFTIYGIANSTSNATTGTTVPIPATYQQLTNTTSSTFQMTRMFVVTAANATTGATYTNNSCTFTVWTTISAGTLLRTNAGNCDAASSGILTKATGGGDATIAFSSYNKPVRLEVRMVAGGGGGGSSGTGTSGGSGATGGTSTFGSLTATGGGGGQLSSTGVHANAAGGTGGAGCDAALIGGGGTVSANTVASNLVGPIGGSSIFGSGGTGGNANGGSGASNAGYGGGGGGAGGGGSVQSGQSGAGGGYCEGNVYTPGTNISYSMGVGGTLGAAGTSGGGGGPGGQGTAIVGEFYNY